jgi:prepilin-type N-terminal cleavage/methylation domain-containing protein
LYGVSADEVSAMGQRRQDEGFTLIELMVVVLVVAVLLAIAIPAFLGSRSRSQDAAAKSNLRNVLTSATTQSSGASVWPSPAQLAGDSPGVTLVGGPSTGVGVVSVFSAGAVFFAAALTGGGTCHVVQANLSSVPTWSSHPGPRCSAGPGHSVSTGAGPPPAPCPSAGEAFGFVDGPGASARFNNAAMIDVSGDGTVYVADFSNNAIRVVSPAGVVSTLAGDAAPGDVDGVGSSARFRNPFGVILGSNGDLFVTEYAGNRVRRVTPGGVVTTVAGSPTGASGNSDGVGSTASFSGPSGLDIGPDGALWVADRGNNLIRRVTLAGTVTTVAGSTLGYVDGTGAGARFNGPGTVWFRPDGTMLIPDRFNRRVRLMTMAGVVTTLAGNGSGPPTGVAQQVDGPSATAQFNDPITLAEDSSGTIWVGDDPGKIRVIAQDGSVSTVSGDGSQCVVNGTLETARFISPHSLGFDDAGALYIADWHSNAIRKIAP